jgi:hypothetical protein
VCSSAFGAVSNRQRAIRGESSCSTERVTTTSGNKASVAEPSPVGGGLWGANCRRIGRDVLGCPPTQAYAARRTKEGKTKRQNPPLPERYIARETYHALQADLASSIPAYRRIERYQQNPSRASGTAGHSR